MEGGIGGRGLSFGTHLAKRRAKQGARFGRAPPCILMRLPARVSLQVPVFPRLGNGLIRSSFVLAPQLYSGRLSNAVGQFNQALLLLRLRIVDGNHARFAYAHRGTSLAPGATAPEDVACFMQ